MVTFLLGAVFLIAVAVALVALSVIINGAEYDRWCETYNLESIQWPIEVLTKEGQVIAKGVCIERRAHR
jgi:hypothetical protein